MKRLVFTFLVVMNIVLVSLLFVLHYDEICGVLGVGSDKSGETLEQIGQIEHTGRVEAEVEDEPVATVTKAEETTEPATEPTKPTPTPAQAKAKSVSQTPATPQVSREDRIKEAILKKERAEIPLRAQEVDRVYGITINDFVLTSANTGYLVTVWDFDEKQELNAMEWAANNHKDKYIRKKKTIYVEVKRIGVNGWGEVMWSSDWSSAKYNLHKK